MITGWTSEYVTSRAAAEGFKWITVQRREPRPTDIVARAHAHGLLCGVWDDAVEVNGPAQDAWGFDFFIGQVEGPNQYQNMLASLSSFRAAHPDMPAAIVTNVGGFTRDDGSPAPEKAAPFINAGFACIAEGHRCENNDVDPRVRAAWIEQNLGWPAQPMAGLGNGCTPANYPGIEQSSGYSWFPAERLWQL